jgi:putative transposase
MGGKKINGRKRQLLVDVRGNSFVVVVHAADLQDREALVLLLAEYAHRWPRVLVILADTAYRAEELAEVEREYGIELRIVEKPAEQKGFIVQKLRWIVERSFGWLGRYRRLAKDYEALPQSSESWIHLASIGRLLQRLFPDPAAEQPYTNQQRTPTLGALRAQPIGLCS